MRKFILGIACLLTCIAAAAQGHVSTRKYILSDFTDKVTKVVVPSDEIMASSFRQEIVDVWNISAFEFCTVDEFESLKGSEDYYFLIITANRFKGESEPGLYFLSLIKGGEGADKSISNMHEVISIPLAATDGSSGRELVFMGSIIKAVQDFTYAAMESEKTAYSLEKWFNANYSHYGKMMSIYMAKEDLSMSVKDSELEKYLDSDFIICEADEADERYMGAPFNTLVSYSVAPVDPESGSYSYQLLFRADTMELYYITRHRIKPKSLAGFTKEDLKWLSARR